VADSEFRMRGNDLMEHALGRSSRLEFDAWYNNDEQAWGLDDWCRDVRRALGRGSVRAMYPEVPGWLPQLRMRDDGPDYESDEMWSDDR